MENKVTNNLRKRYSTFEYVGFSRKVENNNLGVSFTFRIIPDIIFTPYLRFKNLPRNFSSLDEEILDNLILHMGLAEIPSYWKATCSPVIKVKAGRLQEDQIKWWMDLMMKGMGQFYYENKINFLKPGFLAIESEKGGDKPQLAKVTGDKILVPVGGGKDSATTIEIFQKNKMRVGALMVNPPSASRETIKKAGINGAIVVERAIDPRLIELNKKGYLNGHTPISSVFAFISIFCGYIYGYKNIAFSNERSSNEGNVSYLGKEINHQYSKTYEFENKFREYNLKYLSGINYFSFLRPLYELQISKIFSKYSKYFSTIRSCNVGQKLGGIWCCHCPKCLSTFILLYPFLGKRILGIFPEDLYKNKSLFSLAEDLILEKRVKPFECVGTREELKVALYLSCVGQKDLPPLLNRVWKTYLSKEEDWEERASKVLNGWGESNLTKEFTNILKAEI